MKSKQETFDQAVRAVIAQGRAGMAPGGGCAYRIEHDGQILKCAAGHLIPDDKYTSQMDVSGPIQLNTPVCDVLKAEGHDVQLVRQLQRAHDGASVCKDFLRAFYNRAKGVAITHNLSTYDMDDAYAATGRNINGCLSG